MALVANVTRLDGDLPDCCVCGTCGLSVSIDYALAQVVGDVGFFVVQRCVCGSSIINACGEPAFIDFLATRIDRAF